MTTLTFEDIAGLDGEELGSATIPYGVIGLTISKAIVNANADLKNASRGVALKSTRSGAEPSQDEIDLRFAQPQGGIGFFYRAPRATSLTLKAFDNHEILLEENVFHDGEGYAGVIRPRAEIGIVRIVARIETRDAVENSCFYIDDLSFGRELKGGYSADVGIMGYEQGAWARLTLPLTLAGRQTDSGRHFDLALPCSASSRLKTAVSMSKTFRTGSFVPFTIILEGSRFLLRIMRIPSIFRLSVRKADSNTKAPFDQEQTARCKTFISLPSVGGLSAFAVILPQPFPCDSPTTGFS